MCCCCEDFRRTVVDNTARTAPATDPVVLTVNKPLSDLPTNHCFDLCIPYAILVNSSTNTVSLSDGTLTLPLMSKCTDSLRYDSLVAYCKDKLECCCGYVKLRCNKRGADTTAHIYVKNCLPRSSYVAPPAAAPAAGA